jgi:hypothetical protein
VQGAILDKGKLTSSVIILPTYSDDSAFDQSTITCATMLTALRVWRQNSMNDISTPQPHSISPLPEGISWWEAERFVRQRESWNGSPQKTVVEQIHVVLQ